MSFEHLAFGFKLRHPLPITLWEMKHENYETSLEKETGHRLVTWLSFSGSILRAMANLLYTEKVWINDDRKLEGICLDIAHARNQRLNVVVVAHFGATLAVVEAKLRSRSIDFHTFFAGDNETLCSMNADAQTAQVWLALATYFQARDFPADREGQQERLCILIAEHHPMASRDRALLDAVACLPCKRRIIFHAALTDALLSHFGGERLESLLKQLGQQEEDYLSHPMISAAISRAQEKIDKQVGQELRTQSAEEWFKYNLSSKR